MKTINCLLLAAALISLAACSSTAKTGTDNANANSFGSGSGSATAATPAATPTPAASQTAKITPDALVRDLYKQHDADKSPFFQTKDRALVDKYFDKTLADIIWKEAKEPKDGEGALGADPLYNAQDTDIKNLAVGDPKITGDQAEVIITFTNFKEKQRFVYTLVNQNDQWKISDIKYGEYTLKGIYEEYNKSAAGAETATGEFEGKYQIGETTCTVKPIKMAFEVKWEKGTGTEIFFFLDRANDRYTFASDPKTGKANSFAFDDENYNTGIFYRADGKEFPIKRLK